MVYRREAGPAHGIRSAIGVVKEKRYDGRVTSEGADGTADICNGAGVVMRVDKDETLPALRRRAKQHGGYGEGSDAQVGHGGGDEIGRTTHSLQHLRAEQVQAQARGAAERQREDGGVGQRAPHLPSG